jgi:hypothetical protein
MSTEARRKAKQKFEKTSKRSSEEGHKVNALALGAEEGRDKLRKAAGRSKYPIIRRYPNGGIRLQ